ncbi:NADP-dependent oxidoreductase [Stackebrandtia nassauensis]|uniref:Alcohol dehydrogenase GroES domain protein n=1 Tax=Stackebrandtia nassauensis (strain DSM 44728 / CIP 108903 / NRRL B-16338 / NBRC 102104 / LLR-40K-21) TaxID=446470 RepID=D3PXH7_STANL|nr:NADP-dependent oxidoreductase [Stackebrandtia nassauensis]ADD41440.1 Alcohol dehydrogenase GroES domain protein [Stackebrandtia nassauensis DSM 44728]
MTDMRVVTQDELGGPEVLRLATAPVPEPGPTEILVRVEAAGLNPVDTKIRRGGGFMGEPPFTLGWDVSGVVEAIGPGVRRFDVGDEVLGMPGFPRKGRDGAYAEYVIGGSRQFAHKPEALTHVEAAGLSLAGLTAWQALVDLGGIRKGHTVLIHAAAGGVGHLAVQIAAAHGAHVIGTASAPKHDFVTSLGAAEVIDYTAVDFTEVVSDMDIILDTVGGEYGPRSLDVLKPGGVFVPLPSPHDPKLTALAAERGVDARQLLVEPDRADLEALTALVVAGKLRVHVARSFPLADVVEAHRELETGRTKGKLVLTV